jgi:hypothetical protein
MNNSFHRALLIAVPLSLIGWALLAWIVLSVIE